LGLVFFDDEFEQVLIDGAGRLAVFAERDVGGLLGDLFPAAELHVEHGLRADDL